MAVIIAVGYAGGHMGYTQHSGPFLHVCLMGQTKEGLQLLVGVGTVDTERPGSAPVKQRVIEHGLLQRGQVIPHIVGELFQGLTERGGWILGARLRPAAVVVDLIDGIAVRRAHHAIIPGRRESSPSSSRSSGRAST